MPGSVKLRSIKRFGQENDGYEFSNEGKEYGMLFIKYIVIVKHFLQSSWLICNDINILILILEQAEEYM